MNTDDLRYWDNGGESIDRYIVVWPDDSYLAMNNAPFHPQGYGQHGSGAQFDPDCDQKGEYLYSYLGKMITFDDLPEDCQRMVLRDLELEEC